MNLKKIALIAAGSVVVLLIGLTITLKIMFPPERLKAMVLENVEEHINRKVAVADVGFKVLGGIGVEVSGVSVSERAGFDTGRPFVELDRFLLHVQFWPLLERQLIVDELVFDGPRISVMIDANGRANYADFLKEREAAVSETPSSASQEMTVDISDIRLENGHIFYRDDPSGLNMEIGPVNYTTTVTLDRDKQIKAMGSLLLEDIRVQRPSGALGGIRARLDHDLTVDTERSNVRVNTLDLRLQEMGLKLTGALTGYSADTVGMDLSVTTSDITIEKVIASLPPDMAASLAGIRGSGRIAVEGQARGYSGPGITPEVTADVSLRDGRLETPGIPVPITGLSADIALKNATAEVKTLSAKAGKSDVKITGTITDLYGAGPRSRPRGTLAITSDYLDLDELAPPVTDPSKAIPYEPLPDVVLSGVGHAKRVRLRGLELTDARLNLHVQDQVIRLTDVTANAYGGRLAGTIVQDLTDVRRPQLAVDTRIEQVDVAEILSPILPVKNLLSGKISTSFAASTPLDSIGNPLVTVLSALGSMTIEGGQVSNWAPLRNMSSFLKLPDVEKVDFRSLFGAFEIKNGRVQMNGLQLAGGKTEWLAAGSAGLDGSLDYQIQLTLSDELTARVGSGWASNALSLFRDERGRAGVNMKVGGTLTEPKFSWDSAALKKQMVSKLTQEAEKQWMSAQQKFLGDTPIATTNVDTLKQQAQKLISTGMDSLKTDLTDKAKNTAKDAFKNLFKKNP